MDKVLALLILGCLIAMVIGLIKPRLVIRWGEKKTRPRVLMTYGGLFIVLFIIIGVTNDSPDPKPNKTTQVAVQNKTDEPKNVAQANEAGNISYTQESARNLVIDWCSTHQFPDNASISVSNGSPNGEFYVSDDKQYYLFTLNGLSRVIDVLVDPYTGELFFHDIGTEAEPLDHWYSKYIAPRLNNSKEERINNIYAWVEKPSIKDGCIVGKVKNISNREQLPTIDFALFDYKGNQIGTASATLMSFPSGNTWSFKAEINNARVTDYQFTKIE